VEKVITFVGIFVLILGFTLMQKMLVAQGYLLSWDLIHAIFLWVIIVIFLVILTVAENIKEELKAEIKLLRKKR
tara:strand:+ start:97 stop:318 length:222 start_codon:yes stop_codon:yes gene_type:complete